MAFDGVLFDFHGTLVVAGSIDAWLQQAAAACDQPADPGRVLPVLRQVWMRAGVRHPDACWDLDPKMHRQVFEEVLIEEADCSQALARALYDLMPLQWVPVPGAIDLLAGLRAAGRRVGLLSNTALDLRPRLSELRILEHLDCLVLSFEERLVKPDSAIFTLAADRLGVTPGDCVYVGDSPLSDGGTTAVGMTCLLVPTINDTPKLGITGRLLLGR